MLTTTSGRRALARPVHGSATSPISETGKPGTIRTLTRLCQIPSDPELEQPGRTDRQVARQGRWVLPGEDVEAGDRQGVGQCLARQRVAEHRPVADRPRREQQQGDRGRNGDQGDSSSARAAPPGEPDPGQGQPGSLVPGQRGQPKDDPEPEQSRVADGAPRRRIGAGAGSSTGSRRGRAWRTASSNRAARRTGSSGRNTTAVRPVPSASVRARPTGKRALLGHVGREPPGEDRHERADQHRRDLGRVERRSEEGHRRQREQAGQRQPDLERRAWEFERRGLEAPDRVADQAAALDDVAGDARRSRRCPPGSGSGARRRRSPGRRWRQRRSRRRSATPRGGSWQAPSIGRVEADRDRAPRPSRPSPRRPGPPPGCRPAGARCSVRSSSDAAPTRSGAGRGPRPCPSSRPAASARRTRARPARSWRSGPPARRPRDARSST